MSTETHMPLTVLGTVFGHFDGWDQPETLIFEHHNFIPAPEWMEFFGGLIGTNFTLNYETGEYALMKGADVLKEGQLPKLAPPITEPSYKVR